MATPAWLKRSPPRWLVGAIVVLATAVPTFALLHDLRHDDAFITFQFARNLAEGRGLVFNPGQPVFGFTSPLHVLVLALLQPLAPDRLPEIAVALGALALGAQAWLWWLLLAPASRAARITLAALVALGLGGGAEWLTLETNLAFALVLATLWAVRAGHLRAAGVALGLAFLARYDAALLVPIAAIMARRQHGRWPVATLVTSFLVIAPWLAASTLIFGSFLPHTLGAKHGLVSAGAYLGHYFHVFRRAPWPFWAVPLGLLTPPLWASAGVFAARRAPALLAPYALALALALAYALIGAPEVQHWHQYGPTTTLAVFALGGVFWWLPPPRGWGRALVPWSLALALVVGQGRAALGFVRGHGEAFWFGARHAKYERIAAWLRQNAPPDASLLAPEVGTLGYLTRMKMIDPYGLINETNDYPRDLGLGSYMRVAEAYDADYVLAHTEALGRKIETYNPEYRVVKVFEWPEPWSTLLKRVRPAVPAAGTAPPN